MTLDLGRGVTTQNRVPYVVKPKKGRRKKMYGFIGLIMTTLDGVLPSSLNESTEVCHTSLLFDLRARSLGS